MIAARGGPSDGMSNRIDRGLLIGLATLLTVVLTSGALGATEATGGGPDRTELQWLLMDSAWPSVGPKSTGAHAPPTWVQEEVVVPAEPVPPARPSLPPPGSVPRPSTPALSIGWSGVDGSAIEGWLFKPPDTHMAVSTGSGASGRVVMVTNSGIEIWTKGALVLAPRTSLATFLGVPNPEPFDPKIIFDQHSGRFFIVILEGRTPDPGGTSNVHVAISTTSTPSNLTSHWTKLSGSALTSVGGFNTWFDYPSIGADNDSLFITGNLFDSGDNFRGAKIRVFNKASLLAGSYSFVDLNVDDATTSGVFTVQPAHVYGTTNNGHFYLINRFGSTAYRLWEISGDPGAPTIVGNATRTWSAGSQVLTGAPQSGSSLTLDTLSARIMNAVYRGGNVWATLSSDMDADGKTEVFWAKVATNGGLPSAPTIADSGFLNGSDGNEWTFMPSINVSHTGAATINYTQSYSDQFADMRYVCRLPTDPPGTFQSSVMAALSVGFYDAFNADDPDRWGDYSATVMDPTDDRTFWIANERVSTSGVDTSIWGTYLARLAPLPGTRYTFDGSNFNGVAGAERALWRPSLGRWYRSGMSSVNFGIEGDIPVNGDYNGDGTTDIAVWRPSNGIWYVNGAASVPFGTRGDIPVPGHYTAAATTNKAVWRPSNGTWYVNGAASLPFGASGDIPVPADYDGDGLTERAVWRPSNGVWYIEGMGSFAYGAPGDIPVPANWSGGAAAERAVWRSSSGTWYVSGVGSFGFGTSGDIPVPGDYNGDGLAERAVWRPSSGTWYINGVGNFPFGTSGDIPLVNGR